MAIREFVGLFVDGNSWGYSWMAIREYHDRWSFVGLRGWQFVNIMTYGHSWVFVDGNS